MSIRGKLATWKPWGEVPEVAPQDLHEQIASGAPPLVLDVRTEREWRRSRVPGAVSTPVTRLREEVRRLAPPEDRAIVAVCLTAHRSIPAVRLLREEGFEQVAQLAGGMRAWWKAELPVEDG